MAATGMNEPQIRQHGAQRLRAIQLPIASRPVVVCFRVGSGKKGGITRW
jgi:hypothetical protein